MFYGAMYSYMGLETLIICSVPTNTQGLLLRIWNETTQWFRNYFEHFENYNIEQLERLPPPLIRNIGQIIILHNNQTYCMHIYFRDPTEYSEITLNDLIALSHTPQNTRPNFILIVRVISLEEHNMNNLN